MDYRPFSKMAAFAGNKARVLFSRSVLVSNFQPHNPRHSYVILSPIYFIMPCNVFFSLSGASQTFKVIKKNKHLINKALLPWRLAGAQQYRNLK